jgi:hypothetical protein
MRSSIIRSSDPKFFASCFSNHCCACGESKIDAGAGEGADGEGAGAGAGAGEAPR